MNIIQKLIYVKNIQIFFRKLRIFCIKQIKLFLLILIGSLTAFSLTILYLAFASKAYNISENKKLIHSAGKFARKKISAKNKMQYLSGSGMMENGKMRMTSLSFSIPKPLTKNDARRLIVACVQEYLQIINQDEEVRPALQHFPFKVENVELTIYSKLPDGRAMGDPFIGDVSCINKQIYYNTNNPANEYRYKFREEESFEEALKILALEKISL
jgi:hypothetical protein